MPVEICWGNFPKGLDPKGKAHHRVSFTTPAMAKQILSYASTAGYTERPQDEPVLISFSLSKAPQPQHQAAWQNLSEKTVTDIVAGITNAHRDRRFIVAVLRQ